MLRPRQENVSSPTIRRKTEENYATEHASQSSKESRLGKPAESTNKLLQTKDVNQKPQSTQRSVSGKGYDKVALSSPKQKSQVSVYVDKENDALSAPNSPSRTKSRSVPLRPLTPTKRPGNELSLLTAKKTSKRSSERRPFEHAFQKEEELPYVPDQEVDLALFDNRVGCDAYEQHSDEDDSILVKPRLFQLDTIEESIDLSPNNEDDDIANDHDIKETKQTPPKQSAKDIKLLTLDAISDPSVDEMLAKMPSEVEFGPPKEEELPYVPDVEVEMPHFTGLIEPLAFDSKAFEDDDDTLSFDPNDEDDINSFFNGERMPGFIMSVAAIEEEHDSSEEQDEFDIPYSDFYFDINAAFVAV